MIDVLLGILLLIGCLNILLQRRVSSERLMRATAIALALAAIAVPLISWFWTYPTTSQPSFTWLNTGSLNISITLYLPPSNTILASLVLLGGAIALWGSGARIPAGSHDYGATSAWFVLLAITALAGLSVFTDINVRLIVHAFLWALGALACIGALWSSGGILQAGHLPRSIFIATLAGLILLCGAVGIEAAIRTNRDTSIFAVSVIAVGAGLLSGALLMYSTFDRSDTLSPFVTAWIHGVIFPVLMFAAISQLPAAAGRLSDWWRVALLAVGAIGLVSSTAGLVREQSLRRAIVWGSALNSSLALLTLAMPDAMAQVAGSAIILNGGLAALIGAAGVALLEQRTGSDDFHQASLRGQLGIAAALWACSSATLLGLPPFWGFWARLWMMRLVWEHTPWLMPLLAACGIGAAFGFLQHCIPLLWTGRHAERIAMAYPSRAATRAHRIGVALVLLVTLFGAVPHALWYFWLATIPRAPVDPPIGRGLYAAALLGGIALVLSASALRSHISRRRVASDRDMLPGVLHVQDVVSTPVPRILSLASVSVQRPWRELSRFSVRVQKGVGIFEQRFYLAGVFVTLLCIILLIAFG